MTLKQARAWNEIVEYLFWLNHTRRQRKSRIKWFDL